MSAGKRCAQGGKQGVVTKGGLICRNDGEVARVTSIKGVWGYWVNGRRTEPFDSREEAVDAFFSEVPLGLNIDAAIRAYQEREPNEFTAEWMPRVLRAAKKQREAEAAKQGKGTPRVITTEEARGALPLGTVVRSDEGTIACRFDDRYGVVFGDDRPFTWSALQLPLTVLFTPEAGVELLRPDMAALSDELREKFRDRRSQVRLASDPVWMRDNNPAAPGEADQPGNSGGLP